MAQSLNRVSITSGTTSKPTLSPSNFGNTMALNHRSIANSPPPLPRISANMMNIGGSTPEELAAKKAAEEKKVIMQEPEKPVELQDEDDQQYMLSEEDDTEILPAVKSSQPRFPASYQMEISAYIILALVVGGLYFVAYVVSLFASRSLTQLIYHHYPRLDLKPGAFVSDRESYFVILLAISASRIVVPFTTFWMLRPLSQSWKRLVNFILDLLFVVIDGLIVASLFISWGFLCNNGILGFELCNDTPSRFCNVYQGSFPNRCPPTPMTLSSTDLHPTGAFFVLLVAECLLLLLGIAMAIINRQLDLAAREYKIVSALRSQS